MAISQFEKELIERFFDRKSYYLHGFMNYLKNSENQTDDPLNMVAVGLVVDEIINSPNKIEKLNQLEQFDQFIFYRQQLSEGIKYLRTSRLSTQQMMDMVGSLGRSFAETLLTLIGQKQSRDELLRMVGLIDDREKCDSTVPDKFEQLTPAPVKKTEAHKLIEVNEPWDFFKSDVNKKIKVLEETIGKLESEPGSLDIFKQIKNAYKDLRDWSMIQGDQGIEAISHKILLLFEKVYVRDLGKRALIIPILKDSSETIRVINDAGPGSENLDIVRVLVHQIDKQRAVYPEISSSETAEEIQTPEDPLENKGENKSVAEGLREAEVEPPQTEPEADASELAPESPVPVNLETDETEIGPEIPEDPADAFFDPEETDDEAPATIADSFDQDFSDYLEEFNAHREEKSENLEQGPQSDESEIEMNRNDSESFDSIRDSELLSELVADNADQIDGIDFPEFGSDEDDSPAEETPGLDDFAESPLPGADDPELLNLISDIHADQEGTAGLEPDVPSLQKPSDDQSAESMETDDTFDQGFKTKSGSGEDFVDEADMYFSFAKKALQNLMKNSSDQQALEDMELACYSLKTIGEKLGYQQVFRLMAAAEEFVQNNLSNGTGLKTDQVNTLFSIVDELEKAGSDGAYTSSNRIEWFSDQERLIKNWLSNFSNSSEPESLETSSSKPVEQKIASQKQSEDPLDFLLFDDTSKYFKQLLED